MHILLFLLIVLLLPLLQLTPEVLSIVYGAMLVVMLPDIFLALRQSPPFIPTFQRDLKKMLALADIKKGDRVYDPGCGDGRLVFAACKQGAIGTGFEYSFPAWFYTWCRSFFHPRSSIRFADMWTQDYHDADVILCYLLTDKMPRFKDVIWSQLKPGCRVVSNTFRMPDVPIEKTDRTIHLYIKK